MRDDNVCAPAASAFTVSRRIASESSGDRGAGQVAIHLLDADSARVHAVGKTVHPGEALFGVRELPALKTRRLDRDAQPFEQLQLMVTRGLQLARGFDIGRHVLQHADHAHGFAELVAAHLEVHVDEADVAVEMEHPAAVMRALVRLEGAAHRGDGSRPDRRGAGAARTLPRAGSHYAGPCRSERREASGDQAVGNEIPFPEADASRFGRELETLDIRVDLVDSPERPHKIVANCSSGATGPDGKSITRGCFFLSRCRSRHGSSSRGLKVCAVSWSGGWPQGVQQNGVNVPESVAQKARPIAARSCWMVCLASCSSVERGDGVRERFCKVCAGGRSVSSVPCQRMSWSTRVSSTRNVGAHGVLLRGHFHLHVHNAPLAGPVSFVGGMAHRSKRRAFR